MDPKQTTGAWNLLGSLLSGRGLDQVRGQFALERVLGELSRSPGFRATLPLLRCHQLTLD